MIAAYKSLFPDKPFPNLSEVWTFLAEGDDSVFQVRACVQAS